MISLRLQKRKILIFLILAVFFLLCAIYYTSQIIPNNYASKTKHVQSTLSDKEIFTDEIILELSNKVQSDSIYPVLIDEYYNRLYTTEGLLFLVFEDSLLRYWSDNSVFANDVTLYKKDKFKFFSNAWFEIRKREIDNFLIVGLIKIKNDFAYENQYLKNGFHQDFKLSPKLLISPEKSENNVYSKEGDFLFSLIMPEETQITELESIILTTLYLLALILILVLLYQSYILLNFYTTNSSLLLLGFILDVFIIRLILFYFKVPGILYTLPLFKPLIFASSAFIPSLGDLLLHSISLVSITYAIYKKLDLLKLLSKIRLTYRYITSGILLFLIFLLFIYLSSTLTGIITHSNISFDLLNITRVNGYSIIALLCFGLLILSFSLLTYSASYAICKIYSNHNHFFFLLCTNFLFFIALCNVCTNCDWYILIFVFLYYFFFRVILKNYNPKPTIVTVISFLILFSMFSTYIVFRTNDTLEKQSRLSGIQKLANERDYAIEYMFNDIANSIDQDSAFLKLISRYPFEDESELNETTAYLKKNYFTGYWDKYEILITFCDSNKVLDIQPDNYTVNCDDYFNDLIESYGIVTNFQNFIYLDHSTSPDNYLGVIYINQNGRSICIFIEVFSRFIPRGLGYPELLMDQKSKSTFNITPYSWAKFIDNELIYHYGKYSYSLNLDDFIGRSDDKGFFNLNRYNHLYFPKNESTILIISKKNYNLIDIAAPFSYFFIFYGVLMLLFLLIFSRPIRIKQYQLHFKRRLQLSIISLVVISFIFIGLSSLYYITTLNNNKNIDILKEKSHSVLIELEHKLSTEETLSTDIEPYLSVLLYKLSLVFFSDINLYDLNGTLLATSRADIFNKGLISPKMNTLAYQQMKYYKSSQFIHKETIGDYKYLSAYLPFRNIENQTIAYLNLPYFAKQNELTNEIVTYLTTFINIYVILTAIAVLITLAISNYISKPIQLLKEKISRLNIGKQNEKIDWVQHDEIGSLVDEYNRMVDELSKSAELLAKSERESAWREMAKQIAHEIKNPLTPMKLSVQYLQKSWDEKAPDWEQRLKRFTETLVEQIESLSNIASEFSDFAKMPRSNYAVTDLNKIIENAIRLFTDTHQATFEYIPGEPHLVLADSEQLQRVFINLINNSIQAFQDPATGLIKISLMKNDINHVIRFSDNGCGIPDEQKNKVFYPNFTTKSGGMGLGLAMVKNLIQNSGGEITFESEVGKGTTFIITLPVYME